MPGLLVHSPARIVAQLLIDLGLGSAPSSSGTDGTWPVRYDNLPNSPDACITVTDTQGTDFRGDSYGGRNEHHGVQVRVRAGTHDVGWAKANAVYRALNEAKDAQIVTTGGQDYCVAITRTTGGVVRMGPEQNSTRRNFSVNALVYVVAD